jgi:hypothetical protein
MSRYSRLTIPLIAPFAFFACGDGTGPDGDRERGDIVPDAGGSGGKADDANSDADPGFSEAPELEAHGGPRVGAPDRGGVFQFNAALPDSIEEVEAFVAGRALEVVGPEIEHCDADACLLLEAEDIEHLLTDSVLELAPVGRSGSWSYEVNPQPHVIRFANGAIDTEAMFLDLRASLVDGGDVEVVLEGNADDFTLCPTTSSGGTFVELIPRDGEDRIRSRLLDESGVATSSVRARVSLEAWALTASTQGSGFVRIFVQEGQTSCAEDALERTPTFGVELSATFLP